MSLSELTKVTEEGVAFASHLDGSRHMLSPERSIEVQRLLGSRHRHAVRPAGADDLDRAMQQSEAMERSIRWAKRSREEFDRGGEHADRAAIFGIQQGALDEQLRRRSAEALIDDRLRRLCGRRARGRRGAGGDARLPRLRGGHAAGGQAALPDGGRQAGRYRRSGGARDRHVRLRASDALGTHRPGVHRRWSAQHAQRALRRGSRSRSSRAARARPARRSAAPMSTISSNRARSSARC